METRIQKKTTVVTQVESSADDIDFDRVKIL